MMPEDIHRELGNLKTQVAVMDERGKRIETALESLQVTTDTLSKEISSIKEYANRWKGGFSTILIAGSVIGAVLAGWDHILKIFVR
jgi:hypothetical protein